MVALDAPLLLRYLLADCEGEYGRAAAFIHNAADEGVRMYLLHQVLCDLSRELESTYSLSRRDIARGLHDLLCTAQFVVEGPELARRALDRYRSGGADFASYLLWEQAEHAGCDAVVTFEVALLEESGFVEP